MSDAPAIDLGSSVSFADGHPVEQYRWLLEHDPVHWNPEPAGRGFWAVTRHADVKMIGRDSERFSSSEGMVITDLPRASLEHARLNLMFQDPPRHTRLRLLVSKEFTPRAVAAWSESVAGLARRIVDEVCELGECDLVTAVAGKLPSYVIAELVGIPLDDGVQLYELTETMHAGPDAVTAEQRSAAGLEMLTYAGQVFEDKTRRPGADLASKLIASEIDGERLDRDTFAEFFLLLINAGGDTTRNVVAGAMDALFRHPDQMMLLQSDIEGLMPSAVEELVRWVSPVVYMRRTAMVDCELHRRAVARGDKVVIFFGAANRDPRVFEHPERLDLTRAPNDHVAFGGGGPHFCLGAHFARLEVGTMLRELLTRLSDLEPVRPATWLPSNFISGPSSLPVRYRPRARSMA